jgi:glycosyltransferase involved in cell wall biosynthesis
MLDSSQVTSSAWKYHGLLGGKELFELYRSCDIFVLPSHHEGFPRVIWEAMASSLPVIATKVGSIPHTLKDGINVTLISPKNNDELYKAMIYIINTTEKRKELIKNSRILLNDLTTEIQVGKILQYINE